MVYACWRKRKRALARVLLFECSCSPSVSLQNICTNILSALFSLSYPVSFYNNDSSGKVHELYWISFQGEESLKTTIASGHMYKDSTFVGHYYRVKYSDGTLLGEYFVTEHTKVLSLSLSHSLSLSLTLPHSPSLSLTLSHSLSHEDRRGPPEHRQIPRHCLQELGRYLSGGGSVVQRHGRECERGCGGRRR
jgi:hypothetical protein